MARDAAGNLIIEGEPTEEDLTLLEGDEDVDGDLPPSDGDDDPEGEGEETVEAWMNEEDDPEGDDFPDVPVGTHIKMKKKLKGRISDRDDEIERLRQENDQLKAGKPVGAAPPTELPERPKRESFLSDDEFTTAMGEYDNTILNARLADLERRKEAENRQKRYMANLEQATDEHYERAATLLKDTGISPEAFQAADETVRREIESIRPKQGNLIVDQMISIMGTGSEKIVYYLGKNKKAMARYKSLLSGDPSGLKAAIFLGQQRERLIGSGKIKSKAPVPDTPTSGDVSSPQKGRALHSKYKSATKKGSVQDAYNFRKEARKQGIDVSSW